jgi:hypothetical protein
MDPTTVNLLQKYGQRCATCDALATRRRVGKDLDPPFSVTLRFGSLKVTRTLEEGSDLRGKEVRSRRTEWRDEIYQSEELTTLIQKNNLATLAALRDVGEPTDAVPKSRLDPISSTKFPLPCYCDHCGLSHWTYRDLDVATLVRKLESTPPEPPGRTRFERLLEED